MEINKIENRKIKLMKQKAGFLKRSIKLTNRKKKTQIP